MMGFGTKSVSVISTILPTLPASFLPGAGTAGIIALAGLPALVGLFIHVITDRSRTVGFVPVDPTFWFWTGHGSQPRMRDPQPIQFLVIPSRLY